MREYRGTLTEPGKESPYRTRPVDENLALFQVAAASARRRARCRDPSHPLVLLVCRAFAVHVGGPRGCRNPKCVYKN
eukprot:scaffold22677_cov105-Isochrysis_galbana.AAC.6